MVDTESVANIIECRDCNQDYGLDLTEFPCPNCGGILDIKYELNQLPVTRDEVGKRSGNLWKYKELLPIQDSSNIVTIGEGNTPLVNAPSLADQLGVSKVLIKDESQNPTGTFKDRGATASISAAKEADVSRVALPSAGNAGQAAAAYAAKAGMECHVFLPYQSGEIQKRLVKAHGANLHLVSGNISDAADAFSEYARTNDLYSVATFQTPFRLEGKKAMGFELFEQLNWKTPDQIFYPTGGGVGLVGIWKAFQELRELGWLKSEEVPCLNVVQSTGCAPVVRAIRNGEKVHRRWESPNSIGRGIEVPDPGASDWIIEAVNKSNGSGVAVTDEKAVQAAIDTAQMSGVEMCIEPGAAVAGAMQMAEKSGLVEEDIVLIVNTGSGNKSSIISEYAV